MIGCHVRGYKALPSRLKRLMHMKSSDGLSLFIWHLYLTQIMCRSKGAPYFSRW